MAKTDNGNRDRFVDTILGSIADGVFTVDRDWKITSFNTAAERITGISRKEAIGRSCSDIFHASICTQNCALRRSISTGIEIINQKIDIINGVGQKVPVSISTAVLRDKDGEVMGGVETFRDLSYIEELKKEVKAQYTFEDIISKNKKILEIFDILPDIAESDSTVLIEGKSGTGKELFARAIHNLSHRKSGPFVAVNSSALPENLLESELFGYVKGAFTNAVKDKPGRFAMAKGGTLLLDEIGDLPKTLQVKLLRVLQEREYEPLGSVKSVNADVRIIASTNRNLTEEVQSGNFREDLYYRLNIVRIALPELKERREDIPLLVEQFIDKMSIRMGKDIKEISDDVLDFLMRYDFPGNVRELENIIEHTVILCRDGVITRENLPGELAGKAVVADGGSSSLKEGLKNKERQMIAECLSRYDGSRVKTARALKMTKVTLWRKMKEYGLI
ncbi:MAG: sigma 54-interacting transcriptional regulator [Deltaproteobacteria bacterium]|uniref:Sigma 54-interacting transcriptional regulator n=1 Tax=Candidatus Zymogenus saltonus TaxID=2844893 RepID=A0A9D8KER5_9DELT|nr:sigma 54-interacting transcriptional regulator [Candidatus Zymogenus saltonus]